jgi:hypothetical protein
MNELSSPLQGHPALSRPFIDYPDDLLGGYSSYQSLKEAITNYLKGLAKKGLKCTFRELYSALNIPLNVTYSFHRRLIGQICWEINDEEYKAKRPLLGVILCGETDGYITGKGFFDLMDYPEFCDGMVLNKENRTHQAAFFGIHARRCWLYWSKQRKDEEKKAAAVQSHQTNGLSS